MPQNRHQREHEKITYAATTEKPPARRESGAGEQVLLVLRRVLWVHAIVRRSVGFL